MLVLNRERTEQIRIGDDIVITVLEISRNRVRLGIAAPLDVPVMRTELTVSPAEDIGTPECN